MTDRVSNLTDRTDETDPVSDDLGETDATEVDDPTPAGEEHADLVVINDTDRSRYELRRGDDVLGTATYHWDGGRVVMDHTVVDRSRREGGLGSVLARGALDDLRERDLRLVPQCPFIAAFVRHHPEYQDLVDESPQDA